MQVVQLNFEEHFIILAVLVAGMQGVVLSPIIAFQRSRHISFAYLGVFLFLLSLGCLEMAIEGLFYPPKGEELPFPMTFKLAYLPAVYLHLVYLLKRNRNFRLSDLWHFTPALMFDFMAAFLISYEGNVSGLDVISDPRQIDGFVRFYDVLFIFHMLIYLLLMGRLKKVYLQVEDPRSPVIGWFNNVVWLVVLVWVGWTTYKIASAGMPMKGSLPYHFLHGIIITSIFWLAYSFLFRRKAQLIRYLKSSQQSTENVDFDELLRAIRKQQLQRKEKLTLHELSGILGISTSIISNIINRKTNMNFNEYINHLRIEDFKKLALEPEYQKYSLYGIAREAGFSSKTSFIRAFKKEEGITPKEYLNKTLD